MRSTVVRSLAGIAATIAVLGIVMVALVHYSDLGRRPWLPLGIVLVAAGAVGALIVTTIQAMRTEDLQAHTPRVPRRRPGR
jgi:uncharacterized integral membrane protein